MQRGLLVCAIAAVALLAQACGSDSSFSGSSGKAARTPAKKEAPKTVDAIPAKPAKPARPSVPSTKPQKPQSKPDVLPPETDGSTFIPSNVRPDAPVTKPDVVEPDPQITPDPPAVVPQGAVTKGSFTVWTTPADPAPFENYTITIEVKLPSSVTNYTASDLSGEVIGTDGYTQALGAPGQDFQFLGSSARLDIFVPGALEKVRDTVNVKSAVLNESQNLTLEF